MPMAGNAVTPGGLYFAEIFPSGMSFAVEARLDVAIFPLGKTKLRRSPLVGASTHSR